MRHVVMAENLLLGVRLAHALDHRIVVPGVRQDQAIRHQLGERGNAGLVRHIAGGEDQRRFLAVQVGKLALELDHRVIVAGDVAGAAGAGAHPGRGLDHGADDLGMLAHAEIVVRAPDHDVLRPVRRMPDGVRKTAGDALEVGKDAVAPLAVQAGRARRRKRRDNPRDDCGDRSCGNDRPIGRASVELYPVVLEAFQGICRGFVRAAACRAIDRNQFNLMELRRRYCPTARRARGLECCTATGSRDRAAPGPR